MPSAPKGFCNCLDIAKSVQSGQVLGFAENATVYVTLGDRSVSSKRPIVSWPVDTQPDVKFCPVSGASYGFIAKEDGLYVSKGLMIIIR